MCLILIARMCNDVAQCQCLLAMIVEGQSNTAMPGAIPGL